MVTVLPSYVAKDQGVDERNGIDLHFVYPQSGTAAAQLTLSGSVSARLWGRSPVSSSWCSWPPFSSSRPGCCKPGFPGGRKTEQPERNTR